MKTLVPALALALLAAACGPRKGPEAGVTYFWQVQSSTVKFGGCSDDPNFRKQITPLAFTDSSYFIYRVSADGKTAAAQDCSALDVTTCGPTNPPQSFDVIGNELTTTSTSKQALTGTTCAEQVDQTWTLTDQITTCTVDISNLISLVDDPVACDALDAQQKAISPNGLGVQGCVVTFHLTGALR